MSSRSATRRSVLEVRPDPNGIALFDDLRRVRLEIEPEDGLVAPRGAEVELFLAVAPREPVAARTVRTRYDPCRLADQRIACDSEAELTDISRLPRLGFTGAAENCGEPAVLGRFLGL